MRLDLGAANAIQTYSTVRELRRLLPEMHLVVPRWLREPSAFEQVNALHLPRPAVNKLSKFVPWGGWSYIERTLFSAMLVVLLVFWRVLGRGYRVIYVRDTVCAAWLALFTTLHGARVIYEVHDLEELHPSKASRWPQPFWRRFIPWLDRIALTRADHIVSLTETFKTWLVERGLRAASEITVIPDAFDPRLYYPLDKAEARRQLGLPETVFIVGYAGLTFAYRRLDLLVDAFASLDRMGGGGLLMLVGGRQTEIKELRNQARRLGVRPEEMVTPGQVSQRAAAIYASAADVLVIPDTVTGLTASPLKLFEYMALGKPIVVKDMPALREIINDRAALFFEPGDAGALAAALARVRDDAKLRETMGCAAREQSLTYTYEARASKIAEVVASCR
jgi:glycosyltransferase involved in cell wall biosynthesis